MIGRTLVTSGGPHPPDVWASETANMIADKIQIDPNSVTPAAIQARIAKPLFIANLAASLVPIFTKVASDEAALIAGGFVPTRTAAFSINNNYPAQARAAVVSAASGTPFESFFTDPTIQQSCVQILIQGFIDSANVTRSWAFDAKGQ